jgi:hypothetical protein
MVDYDNHAGDFSGNDDLKLTMMPYAAIDGDFEGIREGNSDFGQSIAERYENAALVDGALYQRDDDESKVKMFSWESQGFDPSEEEFKPAEFKRKNETHGSNTYNFTLIAARIDETGEVWLAEGENGEPVMDLNDQEYPVLGNVIIWNGGSKENGPSSTSKTAARTLTTLGREAVVDEDDIFNWFDSSSEARDALVGKRLRRFKIEREGEKFNFYTPVYLDVATENRIGIPNDTEEAASTSSGDSGQEAATDGGASKQAMAEAAKEAGASSDFPDAIDDCIDYCVEQDITDKEDVMGTFQVMANNPESSISIEMMEDVGEDSIIEEIEARSE